MVRALDRMCRQELLAAGAAFVRAATAVRGVIEIGLVGSMCTSKPTPKDIDFLVTIATDVDFDALATLGRRLKGRAQGLGRGADIFLVRDGAYIGRICHYRECWPRRACAALHCGQTQHLNDDLEALRLRPELIASPPVTIWPSVTRRCALPNDVEAMLHACLQAPVDNA